MYRASAGITTNMSLTAAEWIASNAKKLGLDGIWVGEDIGKGHDVFVLTTDMILRAREVRVGTGIVPITVHDIAVLARTVRSLRELAGYGFAFGTGIGGIQDLMTLGIKPNRPVTLLGEAVRVLKRLWAGETVSVENEWFTLRDYSLGLKQPVLVPVFLGVRGPQMLRMAAHVADGVILSGPSEYIHKAIRLVNDEAQATGRSKDSVEKVVWQPTIPTFKGGDETLAKRVVALVVADMPDRVIRMTSVDTSRVETIRSAVEKGGPSAGVAHVTQDILDSFSVTGSKERMIEQFQAFAEMGATEVVIGPPFSGNWREAMSEILQEMHANGEH
ncbi:MAG: hypothetical protein C4K49_04165 [Candidatus Thorarchaeota archaeon]|nr:MAG: hypothetical protein C4K49_04165 [Candidatus Thorarchaeota archaeon]